MAEPNIRRLKYRRSIGPREFFEEMLEEAPDWVYRACVECRNYLVGLITNGQAEVLSRLETFDSVMAELQKSNPEAANLYRAYFEKYPKSDLMVYSWERENFNGLALYQLSVICTVDTATSELTAHQEIPFVVVGRIGDRVEKPPRGG